MPHHGWKRLRALRTHAAKSASRFRLAVLASHKLHKANEVCPATKKQLPSGNCQGEWNSPTRSPGLIAQGWWRRLPHHGWKSTAEHPPSAPVEIQPSRLTTNAPNKKDLTGFENLSGLSLRRTPRDFRRVVHCPATLARLPATTSAAARHTVGEGRLRNRGRDFSRRAIFTFHPLPCRDVSRRSPHSRRRPTSQA